MFTVYVSHNAELTYAHGMGGCTGGVATHFVMHIKIRERRRQNERNRRRKTVSKTAKRERQI